ncbi:hypothetical protein AFM12_02950 [Jiulongibacter sediminis]|uniref:Uncharacterized protein n=1 Tax=Jiulongibacter sediminis TaxID=1605367 RepID=A0A0P7CAB2_9BACT|nr:hypothetical protein AFM12_02950 [Jiulongibacter sediminis]
MQDSYHLSGILITQNLYQSTHPENPKVSAEPTKTQGLFDLSAHEVYPATDVTTGTVGSYSTISPLPRRGRGGTFSVALAVEKRSPASLLPVR